MVITYDSRVANSARGQLNREMSIPLSPYAPENLVSRYGFSRPVPRQPAHLHTQAEFGAYLRDSSRVPRRRPLFIYYMKPPDAIGSVPSLSGHAIAYRWRSHFFGLATNALNVRNNNNNNNCRESAGTGSVNLKVVPNECCLGRSPWTNYYAPLFPTPTTIGMKWAC